MPNRVNKKGVTLVEVMISLVVLLIVFMGLIQAALLSINHNARNEMRDEAVRIASETMADARGHFSTLAATAAGVCAPLTLTLVPAYPATVNRTFRNQTMPFTRCGMVADLDASNKQVRITVTWTYSGDNLTHSIDSIVRNK